MKLFRNVFKRLGLAVLVATFAAFATGAFVPRLDHAPNIGSATTAATGNAPNVLTVCLLDKSTSSGHAPVLGLIVFLIYLAKPLVAGNASAALKANIPPAIP